MRGIRWLFMAQHRNARRGIAAALGVGGVPDVQVGLDRSKGLDGKPLSLISSRLGRSRTGSASTSSIAASTFRSPSLGPASAHRIGIPDGDGRYRETREDR